MKAALVLVLVLLVAAGGFLAWGVGVNNELVRAEQGVNERFAQVQNVYQRRADLIPNLVETVRGFAAHERAVLEGVTQARASAAGVKATPELVNDPEAFKKFQQAQAELGGALSRLLVVVEQYPNLKSDQTFLALQNQLEGTENRITVERRRYNEGVRDFNSQVRVFPRSLVASLRGFKEKPFFEAAPGSEQAPRVKF